MTERHYEYSVVNKLFFKIYVSVKVTADGH